METWVSGLEAIELMKQDKMVSSGENKIYKIIEGNVYYKRPWQKDTDYKRDHSFDFTAKYKEHIEPKLKGWERMPLGENYYYIDGYSVEITKDERDLPNTLADVRYNQASYFSTRVKAEEIQFKQMLFRKLQRFSDENGCSEVNWNERQDKYVIYYNGEVKVDITWTYKRFGEVYFVSYEVAEKAIELFHDELVKYFTM